jgi:hypothetical protein
MRAILTTAQMKSVTMFHIFFQLCQFFKLSSKKLIFLNSLFFVWKNVFQHFQSMNVKMSLNFLLDYINLFGQGINFDWTNFF